MLNPDRRGGARAVARARCRISVRFERASSFVREYAENLSVGGIFVTGAHHLERLEELELDIDLPGLGSFRIQAEAAHILGPDQATRLRREPGAGLAIRRAPIGFHRALRLYLERVGRRKDCAV